MLGVHVRCVMTDIVCAWIPVTVDRERDVTLRRMLVSDAMADILNEA